MNTKTLYLNLLAAALLMGAGAANAAKPVGLADSIRMQMRSASSEIEADLRANVKEETQKLDVAGVEAGEVRLVESQAQGEEKNAPRALLETADAGMDASVGDLLRQDLASKALQVPGLHGVYRYMALTAINVAITAAE